MFLHRIEHVGSVCLRLSEQPLHSGSGSVRAGIPQSEQVVVQYLQNAYPFRLYSGCDGKCRLLGRR